MHSMFPAWLDLVAALGLIVALSFAYARLRRWSGFSFLGQMVLGASFGCVAALEIQHPIEPFDGMILDLRNTPIALAGAFLNGPASLVTLAIGLTARVGIGGVGMFAGMLGMIFALCAGRVWAHWFRDPDDRGFLTFCVLAMMMSSHLLAAFILPYDLMAWFFSNAALSLFVLNLITVPLLAGILEAERRSFETEQTSRASAVEGRDTGLMPLPALQRECAFRATALGDGSFSQALVIRVKSAHFFSIWDTVPMRKRLLASMRLRLAMALPQSDLASVYETSMLVLPLTQSELLGLADTKTTVRRAATEELYSIVGTLGHRIEIDLSLLDLRPENDVLEGLGGVENAATKPRGRVLTRLRSKPQTTSPDQAPIVDQVEPQLECLFAKADFLMKQKVTRHVRSG